MQDKNSKKTGAEKRDHFRIDEFIPVVVTPVNIDREETEAFLKTVKSSKSFSLLDVFSPKVMDSGHVSADFYDDRKLYNMVAEIRTKLDFVINHLLLDKEGLLSAPKKNVNLSAAGIKLIVDVPVNVNDIVEVKMLLPATPPVAVFAYGEIKRARPLDDGRTDIAIKYINMDDSVREEIIQYALSSQREIIRKKREAGTEKKYR
ncbi:MAG: PilZ domain-containing protein [Nitrospirota bacterium]|nr:PilZ domain-containing protein [Nitrospirota bacterium]